MTSPVTKSDQASLKRCQHLGILLHATNVIALHERTYSLNSTLVTAVGNYSGSGGKAQASLNLVYFPLRGEGRKDGREERASTLGLFLKTLSMIRPGSADCDQ